MALQYGKVLRKCKLSIIGLNHFLRDESVSENIFCSFRVRYLYLSVDNVTTFLKSLSCFALCK